MKMILGLVGGSRADRDGWPTHSSERNSQEMRRIVISSLEQSCVHGARLHRDPSYECDLTLRRPVQIELQSIRHAMAMGKLADVTVLFPHERFHDIHAI